MQSFIVRTVPEPRDVCVRVLNPDLAMVTRPRDHSRPPDTLAALPLKSALTIANCLAAQFDTDVSVIGCHQA